jgi:hypothetical protein
MGIIIASPLFFCLAVCLMERHSKKRKKYQRQREMDHRLEWTEWW